MKLKLFVSILIFSALVLTSQNSPVIYGLSRTSVPAAIYLSKINPANGVVTNISSSSVAKAERVPMSTIDPINMVYYFVNETGNLIGLDLNNGSIVSNPLMTSSNCKYFDQLCYNTGDATIYGLARNNLIPAIYLAKVNPNTGVFTNISNTPVGTAELLPGSAIDPLNGIYYFIDDQHHIVGLSLISGAIVSSQAMTNSAALYFDHLIFNCADASIYGLARNSSPAAIYLAKINPATGVISNVSVNSVASSVNMAGATIDYVNSVYYFLNGNSQFVGVDLNTGSIVSSQTINNTNATYFDQFLAFPKNCESNEPNNNNNDSQNLISNIFPQPASNDLSVETINQNDYVIELINSAGKIEFKSQYNEVKNIQLNLRQLNNGLYFLRIYNANTVELRKVMIQN